MIPIPYIITTKTQDPTASYPREAPLLVDRRAVATLDEAFQVATDAIDHNDQTRGTLPGPSRDAYMLSAANLPEAGGAIGPLPDGSVIEVERVSWPYLQAGRTRSGDHDAIIAAYNAAQA